MRIGVIIPPSFGHDAYMPRQVMFAERVPWDSQGTYRSGNLDVYFEYIDEKGNNWLQQCVLASMQRT